MPSRFIRIPNKHSKGRYIYANQSALALAWRLYFTDYRQLRRLGFGRKSLMILMAHKLGLNSLLSIRETPISGNLLVESHKGYLVFDLSRGAVIKFFDDDIDMDTVRGEIDTLQKIQHFEFAPTLRSWNESERWYEIEYIRGVSGRVMLLGNGNKLFDVLDTRIIPCLESIIMHCSPLTISAEKYVDELIYSANWDRLSEQAKDHKFVKKVRKYVDSYASKIRSEQYKQVLLVFSHGDLSPHNMIVNRKRDTIIDWENAGMRSALFDYYNYFFTAFNMHMNLDDLVIVKGIESLQRRLQSKSIIFTNALLPFTGLYKLVYRLEKIAMLLTNRLKEEHINLIKRYIDSFDRFESYAR